LLSLSVYLHSSRAGKAGIVLMASLHVCVRKPKRREMLEERSNGFTLLCSSSIPHRFIFLFSV